MGKPSRELRGGRFGEHGELGARRTLSLRFIPVNGHGLPSVAAGRKPASGTDGNSGIAGHRDGFFRGLKDIGPADTIQLETLRGTEVYRVERTWVVDPEDVSVLDATLTPSLTLVTCYPFYHVGPAPQRYIVRAVRTHTALALRRGR